VKIGYARVSTEEQNLSLQKQTLKAAGCKVIIEDQGISGGQVTRPGLADALTRLKKGYVLVVWKPGPPRSFARASHRDHWHRQGLAAQTETATSAACKRADRLRQGKPRCCRGTVRGGREDITAGARPKLRSWANAILQPERRFRKRLSGPLLMHDRQA
jgi:hypothetical protein